MITFKMAKKLEAAGWTKKTTLAYCLTAEGVWLLLPVGPPITITSPRYSPEQSREVILAPTLSEILDDLPGRGLCLYKTEIGYWLEYRGNEVTETDIYPNPADAAAKLWIKLEGR